MALDGIAERLCCEPGELRSFGVADIVSRLVESVWQEAHADALLKPAPVVVVTPRGSWEDEGDAETPVVPYPFDR